MTGEIKSNVYQIEYDTNLPHAIAMIEAIEAILKAKANTRGLRVEKYSKEFKDTGKAWNLQVTAICIPEFDTYDIHHPTNISNDNNNIDSKISEA